MGILVVGETRETGLHPVSVEAIAAAGRFDRPVEVVLPGHDLEEACREASAYDVAGVTALAHPALAAYTADAFVSALAAFISQRSPEWVIFPHTYRSRDFVPALAAKLGRGLVTDCTAIVVSADGVRFTRPMFRGKLNAEVVLDGPRPGLVTCQVAAFRAEAARKAAGAVAVTRVDADVDASKVRQQPEAAIREARQTVDLSQAERIVAVGRGIKGPEHLELARALAEGLGAEVAASRPVCDAGWLPMDRQIGSSGQTVAPRLYVALGISGAIQHIVGMRGAKTIVAVNKDPEAPIFEVADYGIVGDLFEVVPAIVAALKG
jgi:electron transfer flavoprotein alpha subunit